jgi:hypothetical protein
MPLGEVSRPTRKKSIVPLRLPQIQTRNSRLEIGDQPPLPVFQLSPITGERLPLPGDDGVTPFLGGLVSRDLLYPLSCIFPAKYR